MLFEGPAGEPSNRTLESCPEFRSRSRSSQHLTASDSNCIFKHYLAERSNRTQFATERFIQTAVQSTVSHSKPLAVKQIIHPTATLTGCSEAAAIAKATRSITEALTGRAREPVPLFRHCRRSHHPHTVQFGLKQSGITAATLELIYINFWGTDLKAASLCNTN
jgi:hypothetical protein